MIAAAQVVDTHSVQDITALVVAITGLITAIAAAWAAVAHSAALKRLQSAQNPPPPQPKPPDMAR